MGAKNIIQNDGATASQIKRTLNERLFEEVCQHSFLYDSSDTYYRDALKKENEWSIIANKLGITEPQKKWKGLRDRYLKERKAYMQKKKTEADTGIEVQLPKWPLFTRMHSLLVDTVTHSRTLPDSNSDLDEDASIQIQNDQQLVELTEKQGRFFEVKHPDPTDKLHLTFEEEDYSLDFDSSRPSSSSQARIEWSNRLKRRNEVDCEMLNVLKSVSANLEALGKHVTNQDEEKLYFLSLMNRFKKLKTERQRKLRLAYEKLICEMEIEEEADP